MHFRSISRQHLHASLFLSRLLGSHPGLLIAGPLILSLALILSAGLARAQNVPPAGASSAAERMTGTLMDLSVQYQLAAPAEQARLLGMLLNAATTRQQLLAALIGEDPAEVLRVALPSSIRDGLPSAVQAYVEEEEELRGVLEVLHEDRDPGSRYLYFLESAGQRFSLHFPADPPTLLTGARVRATGVRVGQALALRSGSSSVQVLAAALPNTFGGQKTLVMLVNFSDKTTQPYTIAYAQDVLTTTSNYDLENSFQQTWLTSVIDAGEQADVRGWYTIALSSTICDYNTLASQTKSAATAAGVTLSAYTRYVYAFPNNACTWWGLGTVGGNPSQAWVNGSFQLKVVGHEMGHNFGLYHSRALECGTTVLATSCSSIEYGDTVDIMGNPSSGHFNAFQKERLGWLNYGSSPPITTVSVDGTYALDPYEADGLASPKALKILKSTDLVTGKKTWYYIESRQPLEFDGFLSSNTNVLNGVVVHTGSESSANSSYLLDMTPETSSWSDPALDLGKSFYDPDSGVTIAPVSVSSSGATVSVSFGPLACVRANPTLTLSPSATQWVKPGTSVTYTVSVTNNDNGGCTASPFSLQATNVPSGWTASFAVSALVVSPAGSASTTLQVTTAAPDGFNTIGVKAANTADLSYTASTSASVMVVAGLTVTVQADKPSYNRNQWVTLTATVSGNSSPAANASVTFTVLKPNGAKVTGTAVTGSTGTAVYKFRLKQTDPLGTYNVTANANLNGIIGSGTTSFSVMK
ncbi:MAG: peptidase M11 [Nitrospinae bacterium]|nr:peptidase M11 [Nitrospinota bacterium]